MSEPHLEDVAEEDEEGQGDTPSAATIESLTTPKDRAKFTRIINAAKVRNCFTWANRNAPKTHVHLETSSLCLMQNKIQFDVILH